MLRSISLGLIGTFFLAQVASADVLWSNRGTVSIAQGVAAGDIFTNYDPTNVGDPGVVFPGVLEDGTIALGAGPFNVSGVRLGYTNNTANPVTVDAIIQFYNTVDYTVPAISDVHSGPLGSPITLTFSAVAGAAETSLLAISGGGINLPDNTFGMSVRFVNTGTNVPSTAVQYLFREVPVTVGTSDDSFAYDVDNNGSYVGAEAFDWGTGVFAANLFFELQGTAVPEPGTLCVAAFVSAALLSRRR